MDKSCMTPCAQAGKASSLGISSLRDDTRQMTDPYKNIREVCNAPPHCLDKSHDSRGAVNCVRGSTRGGTSRGKCGGLGPSAAS